MIHQVCSRIAFGLLFSFLFLTVNAQVLIKAINKPFKWINSPAFFAENADSSITIKCKKGETLFSSPFGDPGSASCPILLFEPSREFTLNARLVSDFESQWDAAQIVVWQDSANWAKVYLEKAHYGKPVVGSIVNKGTSDDCNSAILDKPEIFLQVAKVNNSCFFYYSQDGKSWVFSRAFKLFDKAPLWIGFSCESSFNEQGTTATFSHIRYREGKIQDMFNGK